MPEEERRISPAVVIIPVGLGLGLLGALAAYALARAAPPGEFAYVSDIRYSPFTVPPLPGWNPEYSCNPRNDYQAFEVDVQNQGNISGECILECFLRKRGWTSTAPWSDWKLDSNYECTFGCVEPYRCCYSAEPYRIKSIVIEPGEVVTFRGLSWIHGIGGDEYDWFIQAKFVGEPGEILSREIPVLAYA